MGKTVFARRPFGYAGRELDRGQVFHLVGARNDDKLVHLQYVEEWKGRKSELHECAACGAQFVGGNERQGHYEKRHLRVELSPEQEDARADREERMLAEIAPLALDKVGA